jgi:lambda repressor-like predicted transcriptional regulator
MTPPRPVRHAVRTTKHPTSDESGYRDPVQVRDLAALRAYVRLAGLTERGLAARAGVAHSTVNHLLSGRRSRCSPATAEAIARALGCPRQVFFERVSAPL